MIGMQSVGARSNAWTPIRILRHVHIFRFLLTSKFRPAPRIYWALRFDLARITILRPVILNRNNTRTRTI